MFNEKAPFGVQNLYNQNLRNDIKKIITNKTYLVTPDEFRKILSYNCSRRDSFRIVTALLAAIDEHGTYSLPVLKALNILFVGLKENTNNFVDAARALTPEIRTILFLSFTERSDPYREQVHALTQTIYEFLAYKVPLPQSSEATRPHRARSNSVAAKPREKKVTPPPPPPEPQPANIEQEDSDEELPFDLRKMNDNNKSFRNSFNPFSSTHDLINFSPEPEPEQPTVDAGELLDSIMLQASNPPPVEEAPPEPVVNPEVEENLIEQEEVQEPVEEKPKPEGLDNPREINIITDFQLVRKPQYDDTIESY